MSKISFITISRTPDNIVKLSNNLTEIFGKDHELIVADGTTKDIFQGYNWGAQQAKSNNLVFTHDDVYLLCHQGIFEKPLALLKKPMTGVIGVAGSTEMPADGCWWNSKNEDCRGLVYHPNTEEFGMHANGWPHVCGRFTRVAVLDGVFLMMSAPTFKRVGGFDDKTYKGFHYYDVDVSLRAALAGLQNYVAPIPLLHKSPGVPNVQWGENKKLFLSKFKSKLPYKV